MKAFITTVLILGSLNVMADSNSALNSCVKKAIAGMKYEEKATETIKGLNESIRDCRESVRAMVQSERDAKKKAANLKKIERLQKQLAKLKA